MGFKKVMVSCLAALMTVSLISCSGGKTSNNTKTTTTAVKDTKADKGLSVMGTTVKYDPNHLINNGDVISLDWWVWDQPDLFGKFAKEYQKIHPNVEIKMVNNPWNDYWTKLPLGLKGNKGPAIFNIHNSYHENIINYLAPYDIPVEDLKADFNAVDSHVIDGKVYYIDYGMMTGAFYYNKDMWKAAGLTDKDIPKTWDQLGEVAKKLTIKDGNSFKQAGLNLNGDFQNLLLGMHYQYGDNLLDKDGKAPLVNTETMKKTAQTLLDLYNKDQVGSKDFGTDASESFGQGQSAMVWKWGHFNGYLKQNYPNLKYDVFQIPTVDGSTPYAYDRYNGESTIGINKNLSKNEMEVAQDFLKFFLANKDLQKEICLNYSVFPSNKALANDTDVLANPSLNVVSKTIDRYIWPGPIPATFENTFKKMSEDIIYNGVSIDDGLKAAEDTIKKDLTTTSFTSVESKYKYAK